MLANIENTVERFICAVPTWSYMNWPPFYNVANWYELFHTSDICGGFGEGLHHSFLIITSFVWFTSYKFIQIGHLVKQLRIPIRTCWLYSRLCGKYGHNFRADSLYCISEWTDGLSHSYFVSLNCSGDNGLWTIIWTLRGKTRKEKAMRLILNSRSTQPIWGAQNNLAIGHWSLVLKKEITALQIRRFFLHFLEWANQHHNSRHQSNRDSNLFWMTTFLRN